MLQTLEKSLTTSVGLEEVDNISWPGSRIYTEMCKTGLRRQGGLAIPLNTTVKSICSFISLWQQGVL